MTFGGQTILVTGGQGGIGQQIAAHLRAAGARVVLTHRPGRDPEADAPDRLALDVTSEAGWGEAIETILRDHGALHGLVNAAGLLLPATPFTQLSLAAWRAQMAVNLDGPFLGCRAAMAAMARHGGGAIVNISSAAAELCVPEAAAYCTAKSALLTLTRLAARAGAAQNVRVNAILPGAIDTPMLWRNLQPGQAPGDLLAHLTRLHPIGRIGQPEDVARATAFLLHPDQSFITGAMLAVDGGQLVG